MCLGSATFAIANTISESGLIWAIEERAIVTSIVFPASFWPNTFPRFFSIRTRARLPTTSFPRRLCGALSAVHALPSTSSRLSPTSIRTISPVWRSLRGLEAGAPGTIETTRTPVTTNPRVLRGPEPASESILTMCRSLMECAMSCIVRRGSVLGQSSSRLAMHSDSICTHELCSACAAHQKVKPRPLAPATDSIANPLSIHTPK
mmetsp:Transcript_40148/g.64716  ORF Transcript_40148/g.64716 Transcript_40148/m.64716 type:complete len:205 (+) Transcript_40148:1443-2057(+)